MQIWDILFKQSPQRNAFKMLIKFLKSNLEKELLIDSFRKTLWKNYCPPKDLLTWEDWWQQCTYQYWYRWWHTWTQHWQSWCHTHWALSTSSPGFRPGTAHWLYPAPTGRGPHTGPRRRGTWWRMSSPGMAIDVLWLRTSVGVLWGEKCLRWRPGSE